MAGTLTYVRTPLFEMTDRGLQRCGEKITFTATADAADGSVPTVSLPMAGYVSNVITNPGSTAPTDNWDLKVYGPEDAAFDVLGGALADRDTTNTEQKQPVLSGAASPVYLNGTYTVEFSGNSANSAVMVAAFYLLNHSL